MTHEFDTMHLHAAFITLEALHSFTVYIALGEEQRDFFWLSIKY